MSNPPDPAAFLAAMQERLEKGPHATLGVDQGASPTDVRAAFLRLTKQYHPTKYARQSADIQRLANEVFLGIKGAHDALRVAGASRTATSPGMPPVRPTTMGMPPLRAPSSDKDKDKTPPPQLTRPTGSMPPLRVATTGSMPPLRAATTGSMKPLPRADTTRPMPTIAANPATPPPIPPTASRPKPTVTPAQTTDKGFPRIDTQPGVTARSAHVDRLDHRLDPATTMPPQASIAVALDLLANQQWGAARIALNALAAMAPDSQHVRALVCYAAGRQAQLERRPDEARVDLQRALQLDPQLAPAKAALAELFARRK